MNKSGCIILVGAGPGDPGLLTLKGRQRLREADVVVHDRLVGVGVLAHCRKGAEKIDVGKFPDGSGPTQERINDILIDLTRRGKRVVRLKGGDPFVFGRGGEEAMALTKAGVRLEVVPGVTSGLAAAACAGIPASLRGTAATVALVTGSEEPGKTEGIVDYSALAGIDTVIFYMAMGRLARIAAELISAGKSPATPAAVIHAGTTHAQKTVLGTLSDIAEKTKAEGIRPPAVFIVGKVVSLHEVLDRYKPAPLSGQTVLVTRPAEQASAMANPLSELGAEVLSAPCIRITGPPDPKKVDETLRRLGRWNWVVFTSANGVRAFGDRLKRNELDSRVLGGIRIAAVGPATAEALGQLGLRPDCIPPRFRTEDLGKALAQQARPGDRVLMLRTSGADNRLGAILKEAGLNSEQVNIYGIETLGELPPDTRAALDEGRIDWLTFTSPSAAKAFFNLVDLEKQPPRIASIGPVTSRAIRDLGYPVAAEADPHTINALIHAIARTSH